MPRFPPRRACRMPWLYPGKGPTSRSDLYELILVNRSGRISSCRIMTLVGLGAMKAELYFIYDPNMLANALGEAARDKKPLAEAARLRGHRLVFRPNPSGEPADLADVAECRNF